jgi:hypothetical protein
VHVLLPLLLLRPLLLLLRLHPIHGSRLLLLCYRSTRLPCRPLRATKQHFANKRGLPMSKHTTLHNRGLCELVLLLLLLEVKLQPLPLGSGAVRPRSCRALQHGSC